MRLTGTHRSNFVLGDISQGPTRDLSPGHLQGPIDEMDEVVTDHGLQQPELWPCLSIKSSTGHSTTCSGSGLVSVNSHNWPWTPASRWGEPPIWTQMEMGADLFRTVVNWVVVFEPLVKKIGCDDKKMWNMYLLVRDGSNFFCISKEVARPCKNDAILCPASVEQPLFEMKVYIWAGEDGGWAISVCFCQMHWDICQAKTSPRVSWLLATLL